MNLDEHWYVLLTIRSKEEEVCKYLNENEGIFAFSPKMEFYHRVSKQIQLRTLFGGYVFVPKDDLDLDEQNHSSRQAGTRRNSSHNTWHEEH